MFFRKKEALDMVVINSFLSYLLLFVILVAIAVVGAMIGIKLAKNKNAKMADAEQNAQQNDEKKETQE